MAAGYETLSQNWGFLYTLKSMANFNPIIVKEYLKMAVYEFYTEIQLKSHISAVEKEYKYLREQTKTE